MRIYCYNQSSSPEPITTSVAGDEVEARRIRTRQVERVDADVQRSDEERHDAVVPRLDCSRNVADSETSPGIEIDCCPCSTLNDRMSVKLSSINSQRERQREY